MSIKWKQGVTTYAVSRNGLIQCKGVVLTQAVNGNIAIQPITSKGYIGNCSIDIAKDSIDDVVKGLNARDRIYYPMPLPSPKPLAGFCLFIPENGYGVPHGYYNNHHLAELLRAIQDNAKAVWFVADMLE